MVEYLPELFIVQGFCKNNCRSNTNFLCIVVFRLDFLNERKVFCLKQNQRIYISGLFEKTLRKT